MGERGGPRIKSYKRGGGISRREEVAMKAVESRKEDPGNFSESQREDPDEGEWGNDQEDWRGMYCAEQSPQGDPEALGEWDCVYKEDPWRC